MSIKAVQLEKIIDEIADTLEGCFLNKIFQTAKYEWVFEFRKGNRKFHFLISLSPRYSRAHLITGAPDETSDPGNFSRLVKKILLKKQLSGISQLDNDRIVSMAFRYHSGEYRLVAELMGTSGNIYLLDEHDKVTAIALSRKTRSQTGTTYSPPEPIKGLKPEKQEITKTTLDGQFAFNKEMESHNKAPAFEEKLTEAKNQALGPLKAELKKSGKRGKALESEKIVLVKYKNDRRLADLLKVNFGEIKKGISSIELEDIYAQPPLVITINLDPSLSPEKNIQRYYKKYRKYEKGIVRIEKELEGVKSRKAVIDNIITAIENAEKPDQLKDYIPQTAARKSVAKRGERRPSGPKRFTSSDGYTILVGRSDRENDEITFRIANGRDLWLHARDYPGSHVIVRLPKRAELPKTTLLEAAMLALKYSKAAKAGKGEVTYCFAKNIRKPKGGAPGKVLVNQEKSIMVKIDPSVIREMKDSREVN
ncbi:Fibronectin/fibrinogen-binding protein [hydrothermal vent metagenome]|uniref:Fibronectin/fibrinogen-binding protein n=1 Tax=hydrothermal vent metagenome TaxID=652676 RepID=A0A3B1CGY1_9ZZZZ